VKLKGNAQRSMIRSIASILAVFFALVFLEACGKPVPKEPALKVPESVDFGEAEGYRRIPIIIPLENVSDREVEIIRVSTGCGCASVEANPGVLAPGQKKDIKLLFATGDTDGEYERTVAIKTDDRAQADYPVRFHGRVYSPLRWETKTVDMGEIPAGEGASKQFALISTLDENPEILNAFSEEGRVEISYLGSEPFEDERAEGKKFLFEAKVPKDFPASRFAGEIIVQGMKENLDFPPINVFGEVVSDVKFTPPRMFCRLNPGEKKRELLHLSTRSGTPFEVVDIETEGDMPAELSIEKGDAPNEKNLVGVFDGGTEAGGKRGTARLYIEREGANSRDVVEVPVIMVSEARR